MSFARLVFLFSALNIPKSKTSPRYQGGGRVGREVDGVEGRNLWLFQKPKFKLLWNLSGEPMWRRVYCAGLPEYRLCFRNGWFIRCKQSMTKQRHAVFLLSHSPIPGPPLTPHPDTLTPCSICSRCTWLPLAFLAGSSRNNQVSMATWRQLKNGSEVQLPLI